MSRNGKRAPRLMVAKDRDRETLPSISFIGRSVRGADGQQYSEFHGDQASWRLVGRTLTLREESRTSLVALDRDVTPPKEHTAVVCFYEVMHALPDGRAAMLLVPAEHCVVRMPYVVIEVADEDTGERRQELVTYEQLAALQQRRVENETQQ